MNPRQVHKLIGELMADDCDIQYTNHGKSRMKERDVSLDDVINALRASTRKVAEGKMSSDGTGYAYAVTTEKFKIVIGFDPAGTLIRIVSAMRIEN